MPLETIEETIEKEKPELLALSVTMPQYLNLCHDCIEKIKVRYPNLKVAVGGRAFLLTDDIWKKWNADIYTHHARQLVQWAEDTFSGEA